MHAVFACVCFSHADDDHNDDANVTEICGGPTRNQLRKLMKKTYKLRRKWILDEAPAVSTILSKFPCLKEAKYVNVYGETYNYFITSSCAYMLIYIGLTTYCLLSA